MYPFPLFNLKLLKCGSELLHHQLYSSGLAPSDFILFLKLKSHPQCLHFGNSKEIICAVEEDLEDQDTIFFRGGIAMVEHLYTKQTDVNEIMLKKNKLFWFSDSFWVRLRQFWTKLVCIAHFNFCCVMITMISLRSTLFIFSHHYNIIVNMLSLFRSICTVHSSFWLCNNYYISYPSRLSDQCSFL